MFDIQRWWAQGKAAPVAVWLGHHPAAMIGSQSKLGYPESHWPSMSGLLGEPLRLVPSATLGEDFLVPADAEIVIEGWVPPGRWEPEAPFADYHSYTVPQKMNPIIDVTAITYRPDAIFHSCLPAAADNLVMGNFPIEARVYQSVKPLIPELSNVHVPISGRRFHCHVSVNNDKPYLIGKDVIMATLPCDPRIKTVFVVDDDVDIFNEQEVWWAIATRSRWDTDLLVVPSPPSYLLLGTRGGIDATLPPRIGANLPHFFHPVNLMSPEMMERIRIEDFADKNQVSAFGGTY
jgi:2,5-furandicarboxylate decarboxylase 1